MSKNEYKVSRKESVAISGIMERFVKDMNRILEIRNMYHIREDILIGLSNEMLRMLQLAELELLEKLERICKKQKIH
jgi:hypothetical protein